MFRVRLIAHNPFKQGGADRKMARKNFIFHYFSLII